MRHNHDKRKLNRTASHRKAMLRNMVTSLFDKERIHTTEAKAKEARRVAERMITFARRGDLSARRHVAKTVQDPDVLRKLFTEIAPRFADRPGGYTRVLKTGIRRGDAARTALLELLGESEEERKKKKPRKKYHKVEIPERPASAKKAEEEDAAAPEETPGEPAAAPEGEAPETEKPKEEKKAAGEDKPAPAPAGKPGAKTPAGKKQAKKKASGATDKPDKKKAGKDKPAAKDSGSGKKE